MLVDRTTNEIVYDEGSYLGGVVESANAAGFVPFSPELNEDDTFRLRGLAQALMDCKTSAERVRVVREALQKTDGRAWKLKASLSVLLDLMRHEYCVKVDKGVLYVAATTLATWQGSPDEYKQFQRRHLLQERDLQLTEESVRRFITRMEAPRRVGKGIVSIANLIADGKLVLARLRSQADGLAEPYSSLAIQPYVQEVRVGELDQFTGLALQDIWRYFRHTWTLPYNSTPGRNMQFLIRDAAQPWHPVIGILGLGSSVIQITPRDDALGWTLDAVLKRYGATFGLPDSATESFAQTAQDAERFLRAMRRSLSLARSEVSHVGICHHNARTTKELVEKLRVLADEFSEKDYTGGASRKHRPYKEERDTTLFKKKRAKALYRIVRAQLFFEALTGMPVEQLRALCVSREGRAALSVALQEQKKRHVGSSIIDLVVCGAVPPYSPLLGGKLVAMLATSPTVVNAYKRRYEEAPSHIASAMKGAPITRPADLVFIGTTSLYETHSSQYERIRLPKELGGLRYVQLGKTEGFASLQFSPETRMLLKGVTTRVRGHQFVTYKFGEGVNPKLRAIRIGLTSLGLDGRLLKYSSRRLVYGVQLATNARDYLLGVDAKPRYYWDGKSFEQVENDIARFWLERWALPRAKNPDVARTLAASASERIRDALTPRRAEVSLQSFTRRALKPEGCPKVVAR